jgi:site-specific DNA recombinase
LITGLEWFVFKLTCPCFGKKLPLTMLDAVYVDAKKTKLIVGIKPKPPFKPVFQVAASREGSDIRILNEPLNGSSVFRVETGEG